MKIFPPSLLWMSFQSTPKWPDLLGCSSDESDHMECMPSLNRTTHSKKTPRFIRRPFVLIMSPFLHQRKRQPAYIAWGSRHVRPYHPLHMDKHRRQKS
jgi:hypothetical protein